MYMLFLRFDIPKDKLYEFDLAIGRLVKWPVYSLYSSRPDDSKKSFEFIKEWTDKVDMQKDLDSPIFTNLMGAIKVLGFLNQFRVYETRQNQDIPGNYSR
jgi:hypothetical protein